MNEMLVLTPSALLAFLSEVEELNGLDLAVEEVGEGQLKVTIGEGSYILEANPDATIEVDEEVVDAIDEINEEGYEEIEDLEDLQEIQGEEPVEGGIIKELIKTLAVGGLVRLTKDAIAKS